MKRYSQALFRSILLIVLIPLLAISSFNLFMNYQSNLDNNRYTLRVGTKAIAIDLQRRLFQQVQKMRNISASPLLTERLSQRQSIPALQQFLATILNKDPSLRSMLLFNKGSGEVYQYGLDIPSELLQKIQKTLLSHQQDDHILHGLIVEVTQDKHNIGVTTPYFLVYTSIMGGDEKSADKSQVMGTLISIVDLSYHFDAALQSLDVMLGEVNVEKDVSRATEYQLTLANKTYFGHLLGTEHAIHHTVVVRKNVYDELGNNVPLKLRASKAQKMIYAESFYNTLITLLIIVVTLVLTILVIRRLINWVHQPMQKITNMSSAFASGNYQPQHHNYQYTEFSDIAHSLNAMAKTINLQLLSLNQETEKAQTSERLKSQFLANMSHEIRTPMNAIMGFVQLLEHDNLTDKQRFQLAKIDSSCRVLLALINDILDLSKIEAKGLQLVNEPLEFVALIEDIVGLFQPACDEKGLTLRLTGDISAPIHLICDAIRLRQILNNLLSNAVKFTATGSIDVNFSITEASDDVCHVTISVTDTGVGIPLKSQSLLFEPFVQIEGHSARRYSGTGLGLSISKQLTELMSGQLSVDSQMSVGSCFTVKLPLNQATAPAVINMTSDDRETGASAPESSSHILVVEDNEINQLVLCNMLDTCGVTYDVASNGQQACDMTLETDYDVILMDLQMPIMDGLTATRTMHLRDNFNTPIIAVTANVMPTDINQAKQAGMSDYLPKPIELEKLKQLVVQWAK